MRALRLSVTFAIPCLVAAGGCGAATFQVFPVTIEAPGDTRAGVLTLTNTSQTPLTLQVRLFRWTQVDGKDVLQETSDVIASPPMTKILPGNQHLVRIVRVAKENAKAEESYRLLVDELPEPGEPEGGGVRLLLRQSIPVFFAAGSSQAQNLSWRVVRSGQDWQLAASNAGVRRVRISDLMLKDAGGNLLERKRGLVGYVLAGSEARWRLDLKSAPTSPLKLSAATDTGAIDASVAAPTTP